ncbi:MAG: hypothetical protein AB7L66_15400 [Gemmatimonadales bacterium]
MPVTAKLSRKFYETLGDEVANEMVDWFNAVDLSYRSELREMNQANQAWFSARLNEGLAELRGQLRTEIAALGAELRQEMTGLAGQLRQEMAVQGAGLRDEIGTLRTEMRRETAETRMALEASEARMMVALAATKADLIKWVFLFWAGTIAAAVATRLW